MNDHTSDEGRRDLAPLVPSVIGLTGDDPALDVQITLRAATTALPVVAAERQRVLAVSILAAERMRDEREGRPPGTLGPDSRRALDRAPDAERWARGFTREIRTTVKGFRRYAAANTLRQAVVGVSQACIPDPDRVLREVLTAAIDDCRRILGHGDRAAVAVDPASWRAAVGS